MSSIGFHAVWVGWYVSVSVAAAADRPATVAPLVGAHRGASIVELSAEALRQAAPRAGDRVSMRLSLHGAAAPVDLDLRRFEVANANTRFVVGTPGGPDRPLAFDAQQVVLLRGQVAGQTGSHVFLAVGPHGSGGVIEGGAGLPRLAVTSALPGGAVLPPGQVAVVPAPPMGGSGLPVSACGVESPAGRAAAGARPAGTFGALPPTDALKQIELAVETDYEYYTLFNDLDAAAAYVVATYAAVSDVYIRDFGTRADLTFVRLWDTPSDLFNEPDPLVPFRDYWNANMGGVPRDAAQFFSGRANLPYGGIAYVGALCGEFGYSVAGYVIGFFSDPDQPSAYTRDVIIPAHELGHNCNTLHTHDYGLDTCQDENSQPQRGTIMSYCGQTFTGGDANMDVGFHTVTSDIMRDYVVAAACVADDCNYNGIDDGIDLSGGTSADANGNTVPDECDDCNANGTLDNLDISSGGSADDNGNGIPDECEPDCNGNGMPDDLDTLPQANVVFYDDMETNLGWTVQNLGATAGDWERGVPVNDPGWAHDPTSDSDGSGQCYLTQNAPGNTDVDGGATRLTSPPLDMSAGGLSIGYDYFLRLTNQNGADRILVEMNDSNGVGTWQTVAIHNTDGGLSWRSEVIDAAEIAAAGLNQTSQMRIRFTINDADPQSVVEGGIDALLIGTVEPPVSADLNFNGILDACEPDCDGDKQLDYFQIQADMSLDLNRNALLDACEDCDGDGTTDLVELDHSHNLWITALDHTAIREYLARTGTLTGVSADAAIAEGQDLIITPDRRVLVSSRLDHRVIEFDVAGNLVGNLVASGSGGLSQPGALLMTPAGNLLVASRGTNSVLLYHGTSGAPLGAFVSAGSGGLTAPFGLAWGPNGNLFVGGGDNQVREYDGDSGAFVGIFVSAADNGGLTDPHGLLFLPTSGNLLVASTGTNQLLEYNGVSGAFVRQFNTNGTDTVMTLDEPWTLRLGPEGDVYASRLHMHAETAAAPLHLTNARVMHFSVHTGYFVRAYIMGVNSGIEHATGFDFVPDSGTDCNQNLLPDDCDIASGASADVNGNGVPDECESILIGDVNCDGVVDAADAPALALALTDPAAFAGTYPGCPIGGADVNADGSSDGPDVQALVNLLLAP